MHADITIKTYVSGMPDINKALDHTCIVTERQLFDRIQIGGWLIIPTSVKCPNVFIEFLFQNLVEDLFSYRDQFFETYPIEEAETKPKLLKQKLDECLEALDKLTSQSFQIEELLLRFKAASSSYCIFILFEREDWSGGQCGPDQLGFKTQLRMFSCKQALI